MKPKAAVSHPYPDRPDIIVGAHLKGIHLHFDINGDRDAIKAAFQPLFDKYEGFFEWDNFVLPTVDELRKLYGASYRPAWDEYLEVIADPARFGAPQAHLSAKKYYGDIFSPDFQKYLNLYQEGKNLLATLPFSGYIEVEDVTEERIKQESTERPDFEADVSAFSDVPFTKLPLVDVREVDYNDAGYLEVNRDGNRYFRTTEVHLTFRKLSLTHPALVYELLKSGFYSAFQPAEGGDLKFIATIQGFQREVSRISDCLLAWLEAQHASISCGVTLKREDILSFCTFGPNLQLQQVVAPERAYKERCT